MSNLVKRLRLDGLPNSIKEEAADRIEALEAQLPAEMQNCTIRFMECEKGHGRLTATNWIAHGCQHCRIEALEAALREAVWLIGELERHEGAEGWSEYLRKRLDAFASDALAPEQDK